MRFGTLHRAIRSFSTSIITRAVMTLPPTQHQCADKTPRSTLLQEIYESAYASADR